MTDEMTTITEFSPATGETRERHITAAELERLFKGMTTTHVGPSEHGGLFTHAIEFPQATDEERKAIREATQRLEIQARQLLEAGPQPGNRNMTPQELDAIYREQMAGYVPMQYQQQLYGVPSGASFEPHREPEVFPEPERMPKPNIWKVLKDWFTQPKVVNVTRTPRRHYDPTYVAAFCTPWDRRSLTSSPRRGGRVAGRRHASIVMEEAARMNSMGLLEAMVNAGVPAEALKATPSSAPALEMQIGMLQGVRIVRSMPSPGEAEAKWATHVGIGGKHV